MSRPIRSTPWLDFELSNKFLSEVIDNLDKKSYPIPTPKIKEIKEKIIQDARKHLDNNHN